MSCQGEASPSESANDDNNDSDDETGPPALEDSDDNGDNGDNVDLAMGVPNAEPHSEGEVVDEGKVRRLNLLELTTICSDWKGGTGLGVAEGLGGQGRHL